MNTEPDEQAGAPIPDFWPCQIVLAWKKRGYAHTYACTWRLEGQRADVNAALRHLSQDWDQTELGAWGVYTYPIGVEDTLHRARVSLNQRRAGWTLADLPENEPLPLDELPIPPEAGNPVDTWTRKRPCAPRSRVVFVTELLIVGAILTLPFLVSALVAGAVTAARALGAR